jgi:ABC-type Mn2+/Zn2+ transport system permease subunit
MIEPFDLNIYRRAFLACLVIGFTSGYASAIVLLNRSPLKMAGLCHTLLPGVAIATWLFGLTVITAFAGSVVTAVITGLLTLLLAQHSKVSQDTILVVLFSGAFALGILVINQIGQTQELQRWLMGNVLGLSDLDLWLSFFVGLLVVSCFTVFRRPILLTLFEPDVARTLGVPTHLFNYTIFALLIFTLVTTLQAIGGVLAIGLIVTPAATIRQFTNSAHTLMWGSGFLGAFGASAGLLISYHINTPAGGTIVLLLTSIFLVSFLIKRI